jgi:hypothetical protein
VVQLVDMWRKLANSDPKEAKELDTPLGGLLSTDGACNQPESLTNSRCNAATLRLSLKPKTTRAHSFTTRTDAMFMDNDKAEGPFTIRKTIKKTELNGSMLIDKDKAERFSFIFHFGQAVAFLCACSL